MTVRAAKKHLGPETQKQTQTVFASKDYMIKLFAQNMWGIQMLCQNLPLNISQHSVWEE